MTLDIHLRRDAYQREIIERFVKAFLDLLVLNILNNGTQCGYEILARIHKRLGVLISPGTLYPLLHILEERGIIKNRLENRRKNYVLTRKGLEMLTILSRDVNTLSNIFINNASTSVIEENERSLIERGSSSIIQSMKRNRITRGE